MCGPRNENEHLSVCTKIMCLHIPISLPSSAKPQLLDRLTCKLYCRISALHCTVHSIQINQYDLSYSLALVHSIPPWQKLILWCMLNVMTMKQFGKVMQEILRAYCPNTYTMALSFYTIVYAKGRDYGLFSRLLLVAQA